MDRILYRIYTEIKLRLYLFLYLFNNFFIHFVYYADAALRASLIREYYTVPDCIMLTKIHPI